MLKSALLLRGNNLAYRGIKVEDSTASFKERIKLVIELVPIRRPEFLVDGDLSWQGRRR